MTELEIATQAYCQEHNDDCFEAIGDECPFIGKAFKAGAEWQKEQFENNRLAACDNMTKEEADREQEFTIDFIEKNHRVPTYSDAIEYGRKTALDSAVEWLEDELYEDKVNTLYPPMSIVISKSYESVDEFIQGFQKINQKKE